MASTRRSDFQTGIGRSGSRLGARAGDGVRARLAIPQATVHTSTHPVLSCGITGFALEGFDRRAVVDTLWRRHHVWVRHTDHDLNTVRVSTHLYNTEEQVERLIDGVRDILANGALPLESAP